jgi:3-hydroxyisobutyrate dehydrogenase
MDIEATVRPRVALIGAGIMGSAMAQRLLDQGFHIDLWDRTPARLTDLRARGAEGHQDVADAVRAADIVLTMLPTAATIHDVMLRGGALPALRAGALWVQMATIGIEATESLANEVARQRPGVAFVDAPVSGSQGPARAGQLLILASGPDRARAAVAPLFEALGSRTVWLGETGMGSRMKLVLNAWLAFDIEAVAEASAIADSLGIAPQSLVETLAGSPLASAAQMARLSLMQQRDFDPGFPLEWGLKDLDLVSAAVGHDVAPVARAIAQRWRELVVAGLGRLDISAARIGLAGFPADAALVAR